MGRDKILIVDDDIKLLGSLKTGLQKFGQFDIQTAVHGVQALAILKTTKAVILVTDLQMPRMDGVELLATVTREYPNMLCIVTTSLKDHALRKKFQGDSLFSYINKPFNHIRLHGEIIRMLDCRDEINFRPGIYITAMLPLINMMQKSCVLDASAGLGKKGTITFENGVISDVRTEQQAGVGALQEMLSWGPARYWIKPLPEDYLHDTDNTLTALMMQGTEVIPQDSDDDD